MKSGSDVFEWDTIFKRIRPREHRAEHFNKTLKEAILDESPVSGSGVVPVKSMYTKKIEDYSYQEIPNHNNHTSLKNHHLINKSYEHIETGLKSESSLVQPNLVENSESGTHVSESSSLKDYSGNDFVYTDDENSLGQHRNDRNTSRHSHLKVDRFQFKTALNKYVNEGDINEIHGENGSGELNEKTFSLNAQQSDNNNIFSTLDSKSVVKAKKNEKGSEVPHRDTKDRFDFVLAKFSSTGGGEDSQGLSKQQNSLNKDNFDIEKQQHTGKKNNFDFEKLASSTVDGREDNESGSLDQNTYQKDHFDIGALSIEKQQHTDKKNNFDFEQLTSSSVGGEEEDASGTKDQKTDHFEPEGTGIEKQHTVKKTNFDTENQTSSGSGKSQNRSKTQHTKKNDFRIKSTVDEYVSHVEQNKTVPVEKYSKMKDNFNIGVSGAETISGADKGRHWPEGQNLVLHSDINITEKQNQFLTYYDPSKLSYDGLLSGESKLGLEDLKEVSYDARSPTSNYQSSTNIEDYGFESSQTSNERKEQESKISEKSKQLERLLFDYSGNDSTDDDESSMFDDSNKFESKFGKNKLENQWKESEAERYESLAENTKNNNVAVLPKQKNNRLKIKSAVHDSAHFKFMEDKVLLDSNYRVHKHTMDKNINRKMSKLKTNLQDWMTFLNENLENVKHIPKHDGKTVSWPKLSVLPVSHFLSLVSKSHLNRKSFKPIKLYNHTLISKNLQSDGNNITLEKESKKRTNNSSFYLKITLNKNNGKFGKSFKKQNKRNRDKENSLKVSFNSSVNELLTMLAEIGKGTEGNKKVNKLQKNYTSKHLASLHRNSKKKHKFRHGRIKSNSSKKAAKQKTKTKFLTGFRKVKRKKKQKLKDSGHNFLKGKLFHRRLPKEQITYSNKSIKDRQKILNIINDGNVMEHLNVMIGKQLSALHQIFNVSAHTKHSKSRPNIFKNDAKPIVSKHGKKTLKTKKLKEKNQKHKSTKQHSFVRKGTSPYSASLPTSSSLDVFNNRQHQRTDMGTTTSVGMKAGAFITSEPHWLSSGFIGKQTTKPLLHSFAPASGYLVSSQEPAGFFRAPQVYPVVYGNSQSPGVRADNLYVPNRQKTSLRPAVAADFGKQFEGYQQYSLSKQQIPPLKSFTYTKLFSGRKNQFDASILTYTRPATAYSNPHGTYKSPSSEQKNANFFGFSGFTTNGGKFSKRPNTFSSNVVRDSTVLPQVSQGFYSSVIQTKVPHFYSTSPFNSVSSNTIRPSTNVNGISHVQAINYKPPALATYAPYNPSKVPVYYSPKQGSSANPEPSGSLRAAQLNHISSNFQQMYSSTPEVPGYTNDKFLFKSFKAIPASSNTLLNSSFNTRYTKPPSTTYTKRFPPSTIKEDTFRAQTPSLPRQNAEIYWRNFNISSETPMSQNIRWDVSTKKTEQVESSIKNTNAATSNSHDTEALSEVEAVKTFNLPQKNLAKKLEEMSSSQPENGTIFKKPMAIKMNHTDYILPNLRIIAERVENFDTQNISNVFGDVNGTRSLATYFPGKEIERNVNNKTQQLQVLEHLPNFSNLTAHKKRLTSTKLLKSKLADVFAKLQVHETTLYPVEENRTETIPPTLKVDVVPTKFTNSVDLSSTSREETNDLRFGKSVHLPLFNFIPTY